MKHQQSWHARLRAGLWGGTRVTSEGVGSADPCRVDVVQMRGCGTQRIRGTQPAWMWRSG